MVTAVIVNVNSRASLRSLRCIGVCRTIAGAMSHGSGQCDRWMQACRDVGRWRRVLVVAAVLATGCAHYGFAKETSESDGRSSVAVWTVQTPAHWAVDAARVTTRLVQALETQGTPARWRRGRQDGDTARATLKCRLQLPPFEGHGSWTSVDASIVCQLRESDDTHRSLRGRGSASLATTGSSGQAAVTTGAETAALRATDAVALRVSRTLNELFNE